MAPKPAPARVKFRIDGPVPAVAEVLALDRLSEFSGTLVNPPIRARERFPAVVTLGLPIKRALTNQHHLCHYGRPGGFAADRLVINQKLKANAAESHRQQFWLSGQGRGQDQRASGLDGLSQADGRRCRYQITGDTRRCQPSALESISKPRSAHYSDQAGRQNRSPDRDSRLGIDADLTSLKLDNILGLGQAARQAAPF